MKFYEKLDEILELFDENFENLQKILHKFFLMLFVKFYSEIIIKSLRLIHWKFQENLEDMLEKL